MTIWPSRPPRHRSGSVACPPRSPCRQKLAPDFPTNKPLTQVQASVVQQVGEPTINSLLSGNGTIHSQLMKPADGAKRLTDGAAAVASSNIDLNSNVPGAISAA